MDGLLGGGVSEPRRVVKPEEIPRSEAFLFSRINKRVARLVIFFQEKHQGPRPQRVKCPISLQVCHIPGLSGNGEHPKMAFPMGN